MKISKAVQEAGNSIASNLLSAHAQSALGGLGGCKIYNIEEFPEGERPFIQAYVDHEIDSVAAIYLYMKEVEQDESRHLEV